MIIDSYDMNVKIALVSIKTLFFFSQYDTLQLDYNY